jgi:hypothetical protein
MNITCQLTACSFLVPTASAGEIDRRRFEHDMLRADVQGRIGGCQLGVECGQYPAAVRSFGSTEGLPHRGQIRGVFDDQIGS